MNTSADQHPSLDEIYDANAEYYDAVTGDRVEVVSGVLAEWADRTVDSGAAVLDIGAGTGRLTSRLASLVGPREVIAIEPSRGLRAVLAGRVAEDPRLNRQVTIVPRTFEQATPLLPDRIDGAIAFGMLPHLDPALRAQLLALLASTLGPGASALVEVMPPWTVEAVPLTPMGSVAAGRHRIDCDMRAEPVGDDGLLWTMSYRRIDGDGVVLHEARASSRCWVVGPAEFVAEAARAGLAVDWCADDIAEVSVARQHGADR